MEGLRTQENFKFERFFALVQQAAKAKGMRFFLDCGEGRDIETPEIEGEDLSGWLIPEKEATKFDSIFQAREEIPDKWDDCVAFAIWSLEHGNIKIEFKKFG